MKTLASNFKHTIRGPNGPAQYFFELERDDPERALGSIYRTAEWLEDITNFQFEALKPEEKLDHLKNEIKARIRITKQEIFKIGELLYKAKTICPIKGIGFQEWIKENFDFSYETANNFMNVFKYCFGLRDFALEVPVSILYKISTPKFPEELRNFLLVEGNLQEMTNGKLKKLTEKFKEGGVDAIENDIVELNRGQLIYRQMHYTYDMCENALRVLQDLLKKIECRGGPSTNAVIEFKEQVKSQQTEASEINLKLYGVIERAIKILDAGVTESQEILHKYESKILEKI